jgi:uncharacterized C2H2 Zn-finger protein
MEAPLEDAVVYCSFVGCTYTSNKQSSMVTHLRQHTGERPFHCTFDGCSYSLASRPALTAHLRTHLKPLAEDAVVHLCPEPGCGFSSTSRNLLGRHARQRGHMAALLTCPFPACGLSFNSTAALCMHKKRHAGEESLTCRTCGQVFLNGAEYKHHVATHRTAKANAATRARHEET